MVVPSALINTFNGGQMTDLPEFAGPFDGTELFEIVAPGNETEGVNYTVTSQLIATLIAQLAGTPVIIVSGATVGTPYPAAVDVTRVLFNKTIPAPGYVDIGGGAARNFLPIMVRDIKGDADVNPITVSFTGTVDGIASPIVISAPYGGYNFNPLPNGNWYLTNT